MKKDNYFCYKGTTKEQKVRRIHEETGYRDEEDWSASLPDDTKSRSRQIETGRACYEHLPGKTIIRNVISRAII